MAQRTLAKQRYFIACGYRDCYDVRKFGADSSPLVFRYESKSEAIAKAQKLNGWPVDGDEQSYGRQIMSASR